MAERMADRLAARRRQQFVGRGAQLALLRTVLDSGEGAVVLLHGSGGVGKTTLLRRYHDLGAEVGRTVIHLDGRDVAPIPSAFLTELARAAGCAPDRDPRTALADLTGLLLLVDTAELLAPLDRWLREDLLPAMAADTVTVLAGREPPLLAWRTDPGWRGLVHPVRLDNLSLADSRALLDVLGVPAQAHAEVLAFTRGHPLALALVADVMAQGGTGLSPAASPGVLTALLGNFVDTVPSPAHRSALEACAQVLTTTEPLLGALLGVDDAHELFAWLHGLSIIEAGPRGLFPHDLARDALAGELRWRHPEQHADIHRRAGAHYREQFYRVDPAQQHQVLVDYVFLHRENPVLGPFVTSSAGSGMDLRSLVASPATTAEELGIAREMVSGNEGPEAAALLDHWAGRQPGCVLLVRAPDGDVLGLVVTIDVAQASAADRALDPGVAAACAHLDTVAPLAPGEVAGFFRFWMQAEGYQDLGPVQMFLTLHFVRYYLATARLAHSFVYYADPHLWAGIAAYADVARLPDHDFTVGGRTYGLFTHDWLAVPPLAWLELLGEREISQDPVDAPARAGEPAVTGRRMGDQEFAAAVKQALRELGRADGLRGSPLLQTALVTNARPATEQEACQVLRTAIVDAAARMEASPRDRRAFRALHHTYLQPAPTQARAAELLDLPMTTYRRHLQSGVQRLTELLRQSDQDAERTTP